MKSNIINSLRLLFTYRDRKILGILILSMILGSLLEVFGIGLLFPYVAILQDPNKVFENHLLNAAYQWFGFNSHRWFSIAMSAAILIIYLLKGLFTVAASNFQIKFINEKQSELGQKLLAAYLNQPYAFFLKANTSTLIGNLTTSLTQLTGGVIQSALTLTSEVAISAGLLFFLIYLNPTVTLLALFIVGGISVVFIRLLKSRITHYALENDARWKTMIRIINEGISGAKEVQVLGRVHFFVNRYAEESKQYAAAVRKYSVLSQLPRVGLETAAVAGMVLFSVIALFNGHMEKNLFPLLAVFAIATVRIIPSANRMLMAWNAIRFYRPAINVIAAGLADATDHAANNQVGECNVRFQQNLSISIQSFTYSENRNFKLQDIDIQILQGETVAFIGHSGSGKTTLVDLILGLFPEFEGVIAADGINIKKHIPAWRQRIGYIPQSIYLRDDTITRNVAFGLTDEEINIVQVKRAISLAGLDKVINEQPVGLETVVGDRGLRLSGGERQRIGIARALYHDPDLLVLDEATSALDNETERQIVDSILGLSPAKTIIVIAHRLSTVKHCHCVHLMDGGRIIDSGRFDDLAERHPHFVNPQHK